MKHIHDYTVGELIKMGMNVEVDYKSVNLSEAPTDDGVLTKEFVDSLVYKQPLTKDELEGENWYCLNVSWAVWNALGVVGVGVESFNSWEMYRSDSVCVIYDSVDSEVFTGWAAHLKKYKDGGAKEVVMINNQFYWKD